MPRRIVLIVVSVLLAGGLNVAVGSAVARTAEPGSVADALPVLSAVLLSLALLLRFRRPDR